MINQLDNLMIDIETFGTKPNAIILSIAVVPFKMSGKTSRTKFFQSIDIDSCVDAGQTIDPNTVLWWLKKSKEEQETLYDHTGGLLYHVLKDLADYIKSFGEDVCVWGNSARFDLGILEHAFGLFKLDTPWKFYNERDVRTLVALNPEIKKNMPFEGVKHDPVNDCHHQIKYCTATWQSLSHQ